MIPRDEMIVDVIVLFVPLNKSVLLVLLFVQHLCTGINTL
jgi:hypothetical protein